MPDLARVLAACDDVVTAIRETWEPSGVDSVERAYFSGVTEKDLASLTGRKVYVFPASYDDSPIDRGNDEWIHEIGIVVVERYADGGKPSVAWMDERVLFVEQTVRTSIDFDGREGSLGGRLTTQTAPVTDVFEVAAFHETRAFWSEIQLELREIVEA